MILGEPPEEIEKRCAALRQYAVVIGDFYRALMDQSLMSPELAKEAVICWWENALTPIPEPDPEDWDA